MTDQGQTIEQIAERIGTSKQNVYKRISEAGIKLDTLEREKRGTAYYYSEESVNTIVNTLVNEECQQIMRERTHRKMKVLIEEIRKLRETINEKDQEIERIQNSHKAEIEKLQEEKERAEARIDELIHTNYELAHTGYVKSLPPAQTTGGGILQKIKHFFLGEGDTKTDTDKNDTVSI